MPQPPKPPVAPPAPGDARYRLTVAYDGAAFHGFADNPGVATVGGTLAQSLRRLLGHEVVLACAGRTDRGVHAWGQVVSFDASDLVDPDDLAHRLNRMLAPAIVIRDAARAPDDFDARHRALGRTYRYTILHRRHDDPFLHRVTWHIAEPLDLAALRDGARHFVGEHDFASFCRKRRVVVAGEEIEATLVREVTAAEWTVDGDLLTFEISATAFCHQMVRAVTGHLVDVGRGRRAAGDVPAVLAARDRHAAGPLAPPDGLCLWAVTYPDDAAAPAAVVAPDQRP